MSKNVLQIGLAELTVLRMTCGKCGAAIEIPIDGGGAFHRELECPSCQTEFAERAAIRRLHEAIASLINKKVNVEFVVPEKPAGK